MHSLLYLLFIHVFIHTIVCNSDNNSDVYLSGISFSGVDDEEAVDSLLIEELNNNSSNTDKETEITNAIEVFRKYDLWKRAYEVYAQLDENKNKWKIVKTENQAIRDTRKSKSTPVIVEFSDDITQQMKTDAINSALDGFRKYDELKSITSLLSGVFNKKYNKFWQCIVGIDSKLFNYTLWRSSYLIIKYDEIFIQLFQSSVGIISEFETLERIRRENPSIQTVDSEMLDITKEEVIKNTLCAIKKYNTFLDISSHLQQTFDKNHGKYWQSIVKHKSHPISSKFKFSTKLFIHITIGDLSVILFKSPTVTSQDVINSVKSSSSEAIIYVSEMNKTMENEIKKIAINGINFYNEFEEIGKYIKNVSEARFGIYWNCIVGVKPHYDANAVSKAVNSYIVLGFANGDDEIIITLFKSKIKSTIEAIIKARISTPKVIESSFDDAMNAQVIDISSQAITMFDNFKQITQFISHSLDTNHSPHWYCIIGFKPYFQSEIKDIKRKKSSFIALDFEDLRILLFKF